MELFHQISELLQKGKAKDVKILVQQAIDEGYPAQEILQQGLLSGMGIIGEKFKNNEVFCAGSAGGGARNEHGRRVA